MTDLIIPSRFCGPPSSGNVGYSSGAVSAYAGVGSSDPSTGSGRRDHARPWPPVEVSLRRPPPLDTPLRVTPDDDGVDGEEHVLVGVGRGQEGRKAWTSSTMYDADSRVVGTADHLWVAVDPAAFS
jgi:hypothetical protein